MLAEGPTSEVVVAAMREAIRLHGKPERVYTDRGAAFTAWRDVTSCEHAEYAMEGSCEAFVRTFRRYPLEDQPVEAADCIEAHVRSWQAARPNAPVALCEAVRGLLRAVITEVHNAAETQSLAALDGATLGPSTRTTYDNERPPPSPHLLI